MTSITQVYKIEDHNRGYNRDIFEKPKKEFSDLKVQDIRADSEEGQSFIKQHNISVYPAVIVNEQYFTSGGVDEEKLRASLKEKTVDRWASVSTT